MELGVSIIALTNNHGFDISVQIYSKGSLLLLYTEILLAAYSTLIDKARNPILTMIGRPTDYRTNHMSTLAKRPIQHSAANDLI